QAGDGIRDFHVTGVQTCALPISSKALLKNAELAHVLTHDKAKYGIEGDATMSYGPTHKRSRTVSAGIVKGVHFLMKKNKITEVRSEERRVGRALSSLFEEPYYGK